MLTVSMNATVTATITDGGDKLCTVVVICDSPAVHLRSTEQIILLKLKGGLLSSYC